MDLISRRSRADLVCQFLRASLPGPGTLIPRGFVAEPQTFRVLVIGGLHDACVCGHGICPPFLVHAGILKIRWHADGTMFSFLFSSGDVFQRISSVLWRFFSFRSLVLVRWTQSTVPTTRGPTSQQDHVLLRASWCLKSPQTSCVGQLAIWRQFPRFPSVVVCVCVRLDVFDHCLDAVEHGNGLGTKMAAVFLPQIPSFWPSVSFMKASWLLTLS